MEKARKNPMTDSELIEKLSKDWIERDGDSFVRIRKTGRLGWETTLEKGTPYSSYLLDSPTMEELIQRAYPMARQTISAMDTPFKVNVKLSDTRSCTEAKNVYVATEYFDSEKLSAGEKLDIFLGLTAHEGSHLLYTQFDQMGKAAGVHPLCGNLLNIIEDERIERLLGEEKPGLANYLKAVKEYYFGKYAARHEGSEDDGLNRLERIENCILGIVRYPRLLKESEMVEFGSLLLQVEDILTPYPDSTVAAEQAAEKIFALIQEEYKKDGKSSSEKRMSGKKPDKRNSLDDPGKGSGSDGCDTCDEVKNKKRINSDSGKEGEPSPAESAMRSMEKDLRAIASSLEDVAGGPVQPDIEGCGALKTSDKAEAIKEDHGLLADICEGIVEKGHSKDVIFRKAPEDTERYMRSLDKVKQYIPAIRRVVKGHCKEYKYTHMGMRSGILDTSKLADAVQGVPTVYIRQGAVQSDRACVCILVDESGSMIREGRMDAARQTAVLLNEALSGIPNIELFMYGHSADEETQGHTDLRIYREKDYSPKHTLGSLEARDNNRDGIAILETAMRVRKQTDEEVLMFVLSDGAPAAQNYIGREAIAHTKACVQKAEGMGFRIVQICINASYDPALMFEHYVKLENLGCLASDLGKEIAKALRSKIKSHLI